MDLCVRYGGKRYDKKGKKAIPVHMQKTLKKGDRKISGIAQYKRLKLKQFAQEGKRDTILRSFIVGDRVITFTKR